MNKIVQNTKHARNVDMEGFMSNLEVRIVKKLTISAKKLFIERYDTDTIYIIFKFKFL